jgi:hypothetical protein
LFIITLYKLMNKIAIISQNIFILPKTPFS